MRTFFIDLSGDYKKDDLVLVSYTTPRGGRNSAKFRVPDDGMTGDVVSKSLSVAINGGVTEFNAGHFTAAHDGGTLSIMCSDDAGEVTVEAELEASTSAGRPTIKFEVMAL